MGYDVSGKKILVTGASGGIGAALARGFAERGAVVGLCARREALLAGVLADCRRHSPGSRMWVFDLSRLDALADFATRADDELGGIDVLVNNAGIPKRRVVDDLTPETVERVMAINYFSPVRLILALLPRMLARGGGRIVNVSSVAARLGPPHECAYSASKAALTAFTESMAMDLVDRPVQVHVVNPGVIDTELFQLPDNEPTFADVEALPVEAMVEPVLRQLAEGSFEIFVPEWFQGIAAQKAKDVGSYLEGSKGWLRSKLAAAS
jgi:NAD(P)-dependent dehydrogenase (short-subunit alcohol dehydrogenase family)